jgi:hypothetical protein
MRSNLTAAQRKCRQNVAHPEIVDRSFDNRNIGKVVELVSRFAQFSAARRQHPHRLVAAYCLYDQTEIALDPASRLAVPLAMNRPGHPAAFVRLPSSGDSNRGVVFHLKSPRRHSRR